MAKAQKCEVCGLFYNAAEYGSCPYCSSESQQTAKEKPLRKRPTGLFGRISSRIRSESKPRMAEEQMDAEEFGTLDAPDMPEPMNADDFGDYAGPYTTPVYRPSAPPVPPVPQERPASPEWEEAPRRPEPPYAEEFTVSPQNPYARQPEPERRPVPPQRQEMPRGPQQEMPREPQRPYVEEKNAAPGNPYARQQQPERRPVPPAPVPSLEEAVIRGSRTVGKYISSKDGTAIAPVVGWIVGVQGDNYGRSFMLKSGKNRIGRSHEMDVKLMNDESVSRACVAVIVYDRKANAFSVLPGESDSLCYLNGSAVYGREDLKSYDLLEFGDSELNKYLFVPLCGEQFRWKQPEEKTAEAENEETADEM